MKVSEIIEAINSFAPEEHALSWDNPGLLLGNKNANAERVLLCLDVTEQSAAQAVRDNCQMIISHHPLFFGNVKNLSDELPLGRCVHTLMKNDISVYACHTNMDAAKGGINAKLAEMFELDDCEILVPDEKFAGIGIGKVGNLKKELTLKELCEKTKEILKTPFVRAVIGKSDKINRIAVASGSCAEFIPNAKRAGADAIITADMKYHDSLEAFESGICVIDAGHYPTEFAVTDIFEDILADLPIETVKSENEDVFKLF